MLALTRKEGEKIICTWQDGREVEIVVAAIDGNQVRLGIDADDDINIVREQLLNASA